MPSSPASPASVDEDEVTDLRRVSRERAHRELQAADPTSTTVAAVAARWGFARPSRFAASHQQAYGVPPRHTLRH